MDVGLPGMDRLEVARCLRANPRHKGVRLVALTGYGQSSDRQPTAQAGFDIHVVKPVQPAELLRTLAQLRASGEPGSDPAAGSVPRDARRSETTGTTFG